MPPTARTRGHSEGPNIRTRAANPVRPAGPVCPGEPGLHGRARPALVGTVCADDPGLPRLARSAQVVPAAQVGPGAPGAEPGRPRLGGAVGRPGEGFIQLI